MIVEHRILLELMYYAVFNILNLKKLLKFQLFSNYSVVKLE